MQTKQNGKRRKQGHAGGRWAQAVETTLWVAAAACLLPFVTASVARPVVGHLATQQLEADAPGGAAPGELQPADSDTQSKAPELISRKSRWSAARLQALARYREALLPEVEAVLKLPQQATEIPVFSGTGEASMTLGAGHLTDSAPLDSNGNIALSAHRDGSFRVLREIEPGDPLTLIVNGEQRNYTVTTQMIVDPDQVDVLDPTTVPTLTLITCYPFYFVGNAPKRYIVRAELDASPGNSRAALGADTATEVPPIVPASPQTFTER